MRLSLTDTVKRVGSGEVLSQSRKRKKKTASKKASSRGRGRSRGRVTTSVLEKCGFDFENDTSCSAMSEDITLSDTLNKHGSTSMEKPD